MKNKITGKNIDIWKRKKSLHKHININKTNRQNEVR